MRPSTNPPGLRNPYQSKNQPREYTAWYHQQHPGYFAGKSREWLGRQPREKRLGLFARRNKKNRHYVTAYSKLSRRLRALASGVPFFTLKEKEAIDAYDHLREMYRKVKAQYENSKKEASTSPG